MEENKENIVRWTKQMKAIIDVVYASDVHLTSEEIFLESKKALPGISLGTVYRNLKRLNGQGMMSIVPRGPVNTFSKPHDDNAHFERGLCRKLYYVPYATFGLNVAELSRKSGFRIRKILLQMNGVCKECLQEGPAGNGQGPPPKAAVHQPRRSL